ncbi:MAG: class I SAM-dependent methyltransferase [Saprospiraceae bacterium]|nr:class I SAM-dependent methyltransferase [Lewinella sp.]
MSSNTYNHYHQPELLESIMAQLQAAGIDESSLTREHLSGLDEFHLQGAEVSRRLAAKLHLQPGTIVLDVGCGVGGPCRMLADEFDCEVVGVDYTAEYIRTARALSEKVGLAGKTTFLEANALALPFPDASFDVVWTQHAQMNIADKPQLYAEIQRVLRADGRFLFYDIFQGSEPGLLFPVPWAEVPEQSHLMPYADLAGYFEADGWHLLYQEDHTENAILALSGALEKAARGEAPKLGLNMLMRGTTKTKLGNLLQCLRERRVEVFAGIYGK